MKFWSRYNPKDDRQELFRSVEKIRKVAQIKMDMNQEQSVLGIIEYLCQVLQKFFQLRETNPEKYKKLAFGAIDSDNSYVSTLPFSILNEENESLNSLIGVFFNVWYDAFIRKNTFLALGVVKALIRQMRELATETELDRVLRYISRLFREIVQNACKEQDDDLKNHLIFPIFEWYFSIKFYDKFLFRYLDLFEKELFLNFKVVIEKEEKVLFQHFVRRLFESLHLYPEIDTLDNFINRYRFLHRSKNEEMEASIILNNNFLNLKNQQRALYSDDNLNSWKNEFSQFKITLIEIAKKSNEKSLEELDKELLKFENASEHNFKLNQLRLTLMGISAYALFKKKYEWVHYLLNYFQPNDSNALWVGKSILPIHISEVLRLLINMDIQSSRVDFLWDDRHGAEKYFYEFIILLFIQVTILNSRRNHSLNEKVNLNLFYDFNFKERTKAEYLLKKIKEQFQFFLRNSKLIEAFHFKEKVVKEHLTSFFNDLHQSSEDSIQDHLRKSPTVPAKVDQFKIDALSFFNKHATIRNFLKLHGKQKISLSKKKNYSGIGINTLIDKAPFISEWHVEYFGFSKTIGESLGADESIFLLEKIRPHCEKISNIPLLEFLSQYENQLEKFVLLGVNFHPNESLLKNEKYDGFQWIYEDDEATIEERIAGLRGIYKKKLPVFLFFNNLRNYTKAFLFQKDHIGRLVQHNPIINTENKGFVECFDGNLAYYQLEFYSENEELFRKAMNSDGSWLNQFKEPALELKTKGWLRMTTKVDFEVHQNFNGFLFEIPSTP